MKALTILQPWASLIACGAKHYETRSWKTNYRGKIAIHAGKGDTRGVFALLPLQTREAVRNALMQYKLPIGSIIATADLVDCLKVVGTASLTLSDVKNTKIFLENQAEIIDQKEILFGDFSVGRYVWKLENIEIIKGPIPAKGRQGLWDWECEIERQAK